MSNGTAYKTKAEAQKAFKAKHGSKYTSKYTSEPTTRPSHIPQTTTHNGQTVNINYNQAQGGYGHWSGGGPGIGTWIMYDALSDAVMYNALMSNHGYHYGGAPAPVYATTGGVNMFFQIMLGGLIVVMGIGFLLVMFKV